MYAARVREIECRGDCMQMRAVSSIRARRFHFEKGGTYHLTILPHLAPGYSNHAVQMREENGSCDGGNRLRS